MFSHRCTDAASWIQCFQIRDRFAAAPNMCPFLKLIGILYQTLDFFYIKLEYKTHLNFGGKSASYKFLKYGTFQQSNYTSIKFSCFNDHFFITRNPLGAKCQSGRLHTISCSVPLACITSRVKKKSQLLKQNTQLWKIDCK